MSDIIWLEPKSASEPFTGEPVAREMSGEPGAFALLGSDIPDWTRDPRTGAAVRVLDHFRATASCGHCATTVEDAIVLLTEMAGRADATWSVLCCPSCRQFVWRGVRRGRGA